MRAEAEHGILDSETLQATTDDLISTVEETLRVSADGRAKRAEGEKLIAEMEQRIKAMPVAKRQADEGVTEF